MQFGAPARQHRAIAPSAILCRLPGVPESYREPARRALREVCVERAVAPWVDATWLGLPSFAAACAAALVGPSMGGLALVTLAVTGGAAACQKLVLARDDRRRLSALRAFLGPDVVASADGWTSRDGARRLRRGTDGRLRWEELDPSAGTTHASYLANAPVGPDPIESAEAIGVARAQGLRRPCAFLGLPWAATSLPEPAHVELVRASVGLIVRRLDERGRPVGETLHVDRASVLRQLAIEFAHVGPFRAAETASCWETIGRARTAL